MPFEPWPRLMRIRKATLDDADAVRSVHLSAFPEGEGERVSRLALDLLHEKTSPPVLSLVAECDGTLVGHVAFSPVTAGDTGEHLGSILAPLAVVPDHQKRRVGSRLVEDGIGRLPGSGILLVYGDPEFYGRFGFRADAAECFTPPHALQYPFGWQGLALGEGEARRSTVRVSCVASLDHPALW